jgi:hypothetical protein
MPKKTWIINKFEGGLNSYFNHKDIPANSLVDIVDLDVSNIGIMKPVGSEYIELYKEVTSTSPGYGLFAFSHDYRVDDATEGLRDYIVLQDDKSILIYQFIEENWVRTIVLSTVGSTLKPIFHFAEGALRISDANFANNESDVSTYGLGQKKLFFVKEGEYLTTYGNRDQWVKGIVNGNFNFADPDQFWTLGNWELEGSAVSLVAEVTQSGRFYTTETYGGDGYSYFVSYWYSAISNVGGVAKELNVGWGNVSTSGSRIVDGHTNEYASSVYGSGETHGFDRIFFLYAPNVNIADGDEYQFGFHGTNNSANTSALMIDDIAVVRVPGWMDFPEVASGGDNNLISNGSFVKHITDDDGHIASWSYDGNGAEGWTQCGTGYQETATITSGGLNEFGAAGTIVASGLSMATNVYTDALIKNIEPGKGYLRYVQSNGSNSFYIYSTGTSSQKWDIGDQFTVQGGSFGLVTTNDATNHFPYGCNQALMYDYSTSAVTRQISQIFTTPAGDTQDYEIFFQYGINSWNWNDGAAIDYKVSIYTDDESGSPDSIVKTIQHYDREGTNGDTDQSFGQGTYATHSQETLQTDFEGATYTDPVSLDANTPYHFVVDTITDGDSGWVECHLSNVFVSPLETSQYEETPAVTFVSSWQEGNFLTEKPLDEKIFVTSAFSEVQSLIDNNEWGSGSRVDGSTCLCLREYKDGKGTWAEGNYSIGMSFYDIDGQESHMHIKKNVFEITNSANTSSVKINLLLDMFDLDGNLHSYIKQRIVSGVVGARWYIAHGHENDWSIMADANFKDGVIFPGHNYNVTRDYLRISPDADYNGIIAPYESSGGVMVKDKPTLLRENVIGLKGNDVSFYRYKTSTIHDRRSYIGNILEIDEEGKRLSISNDLVRKSKVGKYDTFPSDYYLDIGMGDGDSIIKLESFADRLFVFKRNILYIVGSSGGSDYVENSFKGRGIYFLTQSTVTPYGVAWFNGAGCYLMASGELEVLTLNKIDQEIWGNFSPITTVPAYPSICYNKVLDQLIVTRSSTDWRIQSRFVYDFATKSWSQIHGSSIQIGIRTNIITSNFGSPIVHKGILSFTKLPAETDHFLSWDKSPAETSLASFTTKCVDFGTPSNNKIIHKAYVTYKGGTNQAIEVRYGLDGGVLTNSFDSPSTISSTSSDTTVGILNTPSGSKKCKSFQLKFDGTAASTFEINDITIVYSERITQ